MVNIKGMNKAKVLKALYDGSQIQGMDFIQAVSSFTEEDAAKELQVSTYFDYLHGRVMKVELVGDEFDPWLYDRDNGEGAALKAIQSIEESDNTDKIEVYNQIVSLLSELLVLGSNIEPTPEEHEVMW